MSSTPNDPVTPRGAGSLTRRLLGGMALPVALIAIILGIGGAWAIEESVEAVNDRILSAASRAIAESLTLDEGEIALDLSPAIFGMLETNERDNVYYSVRHRGQVITGYDDLPNIAPATIADTQVVFGKGEYLGRPIRIVAEGRRIPGLDSIVVVEVAETLGARERIARQMFIGLALLELVLVGVMLLLLPIAVRWGLRPLVSLREEMDHRAASNLTPLPLSSVPSELRDLVAAFNGMLSRLDAAISGMRRFTADASHQMRTPLSILRGHTALLRKADIPDEAARTSIADIDHAGERLSQLLVQLLALARADGAVSARVELGPVDMNEVAEAVAGEYAVGATRAGIRFDFERAGDRPLARSHAVLAGELIGNLVDNAVRYNDVGGIVTLSIRAAGERVVVAVEDNGPGIAPAERERMFTRFSRLDRDGGRGGSGLGLSIARALAEAIDAELTLADGPFGAGLRAEVRFPAWREGAKT